MPASPWFFYVPGIEAIFEGNIDPDTNALRMTLVTSSYTPNRHTHDTWSDVSANEVANGNGYTTHGKLLTVTVAALASPSDVISIDCDDQSWTASTITAKYAVIVKDADSNGSLVAGDLLLAYCDLNYGAGSVSTTNGTFQITIAAEGLGTVNQIA